MKKILLAAAACAALIVSGCGGAETGSGGTASLRFIHASPDTGALDIELQDLQIANSLAYGSSYPSSGSSPASVNSGLSTLAVFDSGTSNVLLDLSPEFSGGHIYTLLAAGLSDGGSSDALQTVVVDESRSDLSATSANIRFVNASPLLSGVDIYVTGKDDSIADISPTISNLGRYGVSSLVKVAAGSYRVRICARGSKVVKLDTTTTAVAGTYLVDVTENNSENTAPVLAIYSGGF